jgi:hypothetical protein
MLLLCKVILQKFKFKVLDCVDGILAAIVTEYCRRNSCNVLYLLLSIGVFPSITLRSVYCLDVPYQLLSW